MSNPTPDPTADEKTVEHAQQQVKFHMDRAERFRLRAEAAEAQLAQRNTSQEDHTA